MTLGAFLGAIEIGLIYSLLALGIYVSYRVMKIPDLSVDGTFTTGAAVSAVVTMGGHPILGLVLGFLAGMLAGGVTGLLQTKLGVQMILAGILTMTGLYSINLMVMNHMASIPLNTSETIFTKFAALLPFENGTISNIILLVFIVAGMAVLLALFMHSQHGLAIRATGDNSEMVESSSINPHTMTILALGLANALVAVSGAIFAQQQKNADISMGIGMVVIAIASLLIGEVFFGKKSIVRNVTAAVAGAVVYRLMIAFILAQGIAPANLKLFSALIVIVAVAFPTVKGQVTQRLRIRKAGD